MKEAKLLLKLTEIKGQDISTRPGWVRFFDCRNPRFHRPRNPPRQSFQYEFQTLPAPQTPRAGRLTRQSRVKLAICVAPGTPLSARVSVTLAMETFHLKLATLLIPLAFAASLPAQNLQEFAKHVTEFTLANGLHFIVLERHEAPVVSFHTYVNAGSVDDPERQDRPRAHVRAHGLQRHRDHRHAPTGRPKSRPWHRVERIYDAARCGTEQGLQGAIPKKMKTLEEQLEGRDRESQFLRRSRTFIPRIIEENGGVGMNASTGEDSTDYFYNFPANRVELWFYLESARFLASRLPRVLQGA